MRECPFREEGGYCHMYEDRWLICNGACSWVIDWLNIKMRESNKEEI